MQPTSGGHICSSCNVLKLFTNTFLYLFLGEAREGRMKIIVDDLLDGLKTMKDERCLEAFRVRASVVLSDIIPDLYKEFTAFLDKLCVQQLHIITDEKGGFAVRLSATDWRGVAIDECHEMKVNKDAKLAVIRPTPERMQYIAHYLPFRAMCIKNLKVQLFPEKYKHKVEHPFIASSRDKALNVNTEKMLEEVKSKGAIFIDTTNKGLLNFLDDVHATPEQSHDLLNFRNVGQQAFENLVQYKLLQKASTNAPERKKKLHTFSSQESKKKRIRQVEKERKISQRFLKRQLVWLTEKGQAPCSTDHLFTSISSIPKAIVDKNGLPYKSAKSLSTDYLMKRYKDLPICFTSLPWTPTSVILSFSTITYIKEHATMLFLKYVRPHFRSGALEVHTILVVV